MKIYKISGKLYNEPITVESTKAGLEYWLKLTGNSFDILEVGDGIILMSNEMVVLKDN
jgi:hypothetical protein